MNEEILTDVEERKDETKKYDVVKGVNIGLVIWVCIILEGVLLALKWTGQQIETWWFVIPVGIVFGFYIFSKGKENVIDTLSREESEEILRKYVKKKQDEKSSGFGFPEGRLIITPYGTPILNPEQPKHRIGFIIIQQPGNLQHHYLGVIDRRIRYANVLYCKKVDDVKDLSKDELKDESRYRKPFNS